MLENTQLGLALAIACLIMAIITYASSRVEITRRVRVVMRMVAWIWILMSILYSLYFMNAILGWGL